jgi:hypothetical protein
MPDMGGGSPVGYPSPRADVGYIGTIWKGSNTERRVAASVAFVELISAVMCGMLGVVEGVCWVDLGRCGCF